MNVVDELAAQFAAAEQTWIGTALLIAAVSGVAVVVVLRERRKHRRQQQSDLNLWDAEVLAGREALRLRKPDRVEQLIRDALTEEADHQMLRDGVCPPGAAHTREEADDV